MKSLFSGSAPRRSGIKASVREGLLLALLAAMTLGFGGFTLVGGRLSEIYGQKHCLIAGPRGVAAALKQVPL